MKWVYHIIFLHNSDVMKQTRTNSKNSLEEFSSRLDQTEEGLSKHKDRLLEIIQPEEQNEKEGKRVKLV